MVPRLKTALLALGPTGSLFLTAATLFCKSFTLPNCSDLVTLLMLLAAGLGVRPLLTLFAVGLRGMTISSQWCTSSRAK
jgi:hypothetical protein